MGPYLKSNMIRRRDVVLCVVVLALVCVAHEAASIHKCCPADQQLTEFLDGCVPAGSVNVSVTPSWWLDPVASTTLQSDINLRLGYTPPCDSFDRLYVPMHARDRYAWTSDGALKLRVRGGGVGAATEVMLPSRDFCTDRVNAPPTPTRPHTFVLLACPCAHVLCVRKCCAASQVYSATKHRKNVQMMCTLRRPDEPPWSPEDFFSHDDGEGSGGGGIGIAPYLLLSKTGLSCLPGEGDALVAPTLSASAADNTSSASIFRLFRNGTALLSDYSYAGAVPRFCGERVRTLDATANGVHVCVHRKTASVAAVAAVNGAFYVLGAVFLLVTLCVLALLPELRRTAHSRAVLCHVSALFAGSVAHAAGQLRAEMPPGQCYAVAFVVQFSFLAAFFWLNVMCIDIAWAFSGVRPPGERDRRKFVCYSVYAWGFPAAISAITALLEFAEGLPESLLRPNFGDRNCWFYSKMATLVYFYGPMAALLLVNLCLFGYTAARILRAQKETAMLQRGESSRHAPRGDTKRLVLYLKLFCLMGVTWIFEIISWAEGSDSLYWYVTDLINMLRGVFIFVLFCCKPKVLKLLLRRLKELGLYHNGCEANICKRWHTCSGLCCWGAGVEGSSSAISHVGAGGPPILERNRDSNATTSTFMSRSSGITLRNSILSTLFPNSAVSPVVNSELASSPTSTLSPPPSSIAATDKEITPPPAPGNDSSVGTSGEISISSLEALAQAAGPVTSNDHFITQTPLDIAKGSSSNPE